MILRCSLEYSYTYFFEMICLTDLNELFQEIKPEFSCSVEWPTSSSTCKLSTQLGALSHQILYKLLCQSPESIMAQGLNARCRRQDVAVTSILTLLPYDGCAYTSCHVPGTKGLERLSIVHWVASSYIIPQYDR